MENDLISKQEVLEDLSEPFVMSQCLTVEECEAMNRARELCLARVKNIEPAQRWIPVTERMPEGRAWVLCKCRANIHEVLSWRDGEWYHDPQHRYMSGFVTHWMPLPEPPKEEL